MSSPPDPFAEPSIQRALERPLLDRLSPPEADVPADAETVAEQLAAAEARHARSIRTLVFGVVLVVSSTTLALAIYTLGPVPPADPRLNAPLTLAHYLRLIAGLCAAPLAVGLLCCFVSALELIGGVLSGNLHRLRREAGMRL